METKETNKSETIEKSKEAKNPKERAIVFIDGNNLHRGLKECYGIERLDLEPFCKHVIQDRELMRIYYADSNFIPYLGQNGYNRQQSYFSYVRGIKTVIFRQGYYNTKTRPPTEKKVDVYLASDMIDLCYKDSFDFAFLVSGDADLCPAVDIVRAQGKRIMNIYFDTPIRNSFALRSSCQGLFKNLTKKLAEQYEWKSK